MKLITMNSVNFEHSPGREYPAIKLDMTYFVENLSNENICGKAEVKDDGIGTSPNRIGCKTEDCTDLTKISSVSGIKLEQEERVSKFGKISCVLSCEGVHVVKIINVVNHSLT